jgi:hypothetical protein
MANFSVETIGKMYASGRNYLNSFLGLVTGIGLMSAAQSQGLSDSIQQMYNGVTQVISGSTSAWQIIAVIAAPILTPIIARFASNSAKTDSQAAAVVAAVKDANTPVSLEAKVSIANAAAELPEVEKVVAPDLAPLANTAPAVVPK